MDSLKSCSFMVVARNDYCAVELKKFLQYYLPPEVEVKESGEFKYLVTFPIQKLKEAGLCESKVKRYYC